jgi:8-oxo-dGTP pyrophosphatase MutT (NUDIX family)
VGQYPEQRYLMQLRDNIPGIVYPGCWGFFGGHLESGEQPEKALRRELLEEINFTATRLVPFGCYDAGGVMRHVFAGPLTIPLHELVLTEGWDLGFFDRAAIEQGEQYSTKAEMVRPLAPIHQKILMDYMHAQASAQASAQGWANES